MKILLIEDEAKTAAYLRRGLTEHGIAVDTAADGDAGLRRACGGGYDLLILDVMLPGRDGWSILAELRGGGDTTPVLFLTARDAVRDRVKGLTLGADDYLVKPFAFSELLARVQSVLRRSAPKGQDVLRVADLELDLPQLRATRAGKRLELTSNEFKLLALLATHRGEPLARAVIARQAWDMAYEGDTNVVEVNVRRLRAKVDDPHEKKLIHTVRGVGYVLEERT